MGVMIEGKIIRYVNKDTDQRIDRNELRELVERVIIKTLVQIRAKDWIEK